MEKEVILEENNYINYLNYLKELKKNTEIEKPVIYNNKKSGFASPFMLGFIAFTLEILFLLTAFQIFK
jgi:hypothetical protein